MNPSYPTFTGLGCGRNAKKSANQKREKIPLTNSAKSVLLEKHWYKKYTAIKYNLRKPLVKIVSKVLSAAIKIHARLA